MALWVVLGKNPQRRAVQAPPVRRKRAVVTSYCARRSAHTQRRRPPSLPPPRPAAYYTLASGSLLVINKVAVVALPAPTFLLLAQLSFSAAFVLVGQGAGAIEIAPATQRQLLHFLPVVAGFLGTIYSNIKVRVRWGGERGCAACEREQLLALAARPCGCG